MMPSCLIVVLLSIINIHILLSYILHFLQSKSQLSPTKVTETRITARHRIHVERCMGRIKNYKLLSGIIPIKSIYLVHFLLFSMNHWLKLCNISLPIYINKLSFINKSYFESSNPCKEHKSEQHQRKKYKIRKEKDM